MSASLLMVVVLGLCCCSPASSQVSLGTPRLSGPSEAVVKKVIEFRCELENVPEDELILLDLFNVNENKSLGEYTIMPAVEQRFGSFPLVTRTSYEGELMCVAKSQNYTDIEPTFSKRHYLKVVEPVKGAEITLQSRQLEFFEGEPLKMSCKVKAGTHVFFVWQRNGQNITGPLQDNHFIISSRAAGRLLEPVSLGKGRGYTLGSPTSRDSGYYVCVAINYFNNTIASNASSTAVVITVKDLVSSPDISYTIMNNNSYNYFVMVACESVKGTPPITFSLYKNRLEKVAAATVEERKTTFNIPVHLDTLEHLNCAAKNGNLTVWSDTLPLKVVLVAGPVMIHYEVYTGRSYNVYGVRFHCRALLGSHPHYRWFLNNTLLEDVGRFYRVYHRAPEDSVLMVTVGGISAGTYHCDVSDSFDNTTAIRSKGLYLERDEVNRLNIWVVAIVFGSFTLVVLLVSICCGVGVLFRLSDEKSLSDLEMYGRDMGARFDDKVNESDYCEDMDMVQAARTAAEPDQASEESVDEWPQIEEEKKTLEDEPVEEP